MQYIGTKYNSLTITSEPYIRRDRTETRSWVKAICHCGIEKEYRLRQIVNGLAKSCGCRRAEAMRANFTKHGKSKHPIYKAWWGMKDRCYAKNNHHYKNWGARGIVMCDEWLNNFQAFYDWAIANNWNKGLELDRIDNDGNYEPSNCRWVTTKVNTRNRGSNKLDMEQALTIRKLFSTRAFTKQELANIYMVSYSTVQGIVQNQIWANQ